MKKILLIMLAMLFMSCSLLTQSNYLEDSWYSEQDNTFVGFEFSEKFIITNITDGIRGTIVYDYYTDGADVYVLLSSEYVKTYRIVSISKEELQLYSYIDDEVTVFLRD